jgi:hypothetical protein
MEAHSPTSLVRYTPLAVACMCREQADASSQVTLVRDSSRSNTYIPFLTVSIDTKTLGGAGFASQACTKPFDLSNYDGLELLLIPSKPREPDSPTHFTLNLKTDLGGKRPDGRTQSTVSYEYDFHIPQGNSPQNNNEVKTSGYPIVALQASWKDFKPTYRGRPSNDAEPLDPASIREMAIMCRSNVSACVSDREIHD